MQLLDSEPLVHPAVAENSETFNRRRALPEPLKQLLQGNSDSLVWRRLVPGIQQIRLNTSDGGLRLLKISPGMSMPLHSHKSSELTLIMEGSYSDELGRFQRGDVADLDCDVEHQPITDGNTPCICLVATDASLVFRGFLPKLLQPFTGF
jgi:putative transcriptional regulator